MAVPLLTACGGGEQASTRGDAAPEPAVALDESRVTWVNEGPDLRANARVSPNTSVSLFHLECAGFRSGEIKIAGLLPAQAFPQPELDFLVGDTRHRRVRPAASYSPRRDGSQDGPEHPPHAVLSFSVSLTPLLLASLSTGAPVRIRFNQQVVNYPPIPADTLNSFVDACETAALGHEARR